MNKSGNEQNVERMGFFLAYLMLINALEKRIVRIARNSEIQLWTESVHDDQRNECLVPTIFSPLKSIPSAAKFGRFG